MLNKYFNLLLSAVSSTYPCQKQSNYMYVPSKSGYHWLQQYCTAPTRDFRVNTRALGEAELFDITMCFGGDKWIVENAGIVRVTNISSGNGIMCIFRLVLRLVARKTLLCMGFTSPTSPNGIRWLTSLSSAQRIRADYRSDSWSWKNIHLQLSLISATKLNYNYKYQIQ